MVAAGCHLFTCVEVGPTGLPRVCMQNWRLIQVGCPSLTPGLSGVHLRRSVWQGLSLSLRSHPCALSSLGQSVFIVHTAHSNSFLL